MMRRWLPFVVAFAMLASSSGALAHGQSEGASMPQGVRGNMMELMHHHLDRNASTPCDAFSDESIMQHGEAMMEEMMGKEDHERVEEAMEKDMAGHDALHAMLGMMATGCVGAEVATAIGQRYGLVAAPKSEPRTGAGGMLVIGLIGGALLSFLVSSLRKPKVAGGSPSAGG